MNPWPLPYQGNALPLSYIGLFSLTNSIAQHVVLSVTIYFYTSDIWRCLSLNTSLYLLSGRRDSNPRPLAWKANALSAELLPLVLLSFVTTYVSLWGEQDSNLRSLRQQSYSLPQLAALVSPQRNKSRWRDSNPRPADYKSAALAS